jgi:Helix-turn-helix domain
MKKDNLMALARKTTLEPFYDFEDKTYKPAKTRRDVFLMLASHNGRNGICPSIETLSKDCCISKRQVHRIIEWLLRAGLLIIEYKASPYGTNAYKLIFPEGTQCHQEMSLSDSAKTGGYSAITKLDSAKTGGETVPKQATSGLEGSKSLEKIEIYREQHQTSISLESKPAGQGGGDKVHEFELWLAGTYSDLSLTHKQRDTVRTAIIDNSFPLAVFKSAAGDILNTLDCANSYDHAGDRLAEGLAIKAEAAQHRKAEEAKIQQQLAELTQKSREDADKRIKELELEQEEVEDHL